MHGYAVSPMDRMTWSDVANEAGQVGGAYQLVITSD